MLKEPEKAGLPILNEANRELGCAVEDALECHTAISAFLMRVGGADLSSLDVPPFLSANPEMSASGDVLLYLIGHLRQQISDLKRQIYKLERIA